MNGQIRTEKIILWVVLAFALVMRWAHLFLVWNSDLVRLPIIDAAFYHFWATQIASGRVIGDGVFFMSPLYPYMLGLIYAILGNQPAMAMLLQGILGTATIYLLFRWVKQVINVQVALVAAAIGAIYAPYIFYDATLLTSSLILFLSAIILNLAESIRRQPKISSIIWAGVAIGLSTLARPLAMLFAPFLIVQMARVDRKAFLPNTGWLATGILAVLLPVGMHNLIVGGEFTLTTSSAGMNFYVGNNPEATGLYWEAPFLSSVEPQFEDEEYRRVASEATERELTTREAGRYWMLKSLDWMLNEPVAYLTLLGRKIFYFFNRTEFANNVSIYLARAESPILRFNFIGYWLIAPLGIGGMILLWRRKGWAAAGIGWSWVWAYFAGALLFFVSSEYRLPVTLVFIAGTAYLIWEIISSLRARQIESVLGLVALGLILMPVTNLRTEFIHRGENARMDWFNIGNTLIKQDNFDGAIERFKKAVEIDPYFSEGLLRLGEAYYRSGRIEEALEVGKRAGLESPDDLLKIIQGEALKEAYSRLGAGDLGGAMKEFGYAGWEEGLAAVETTRVSLLKIARIHYEEGKFEESIEAFKSVVKLDTTPDPSNYYNIAFINWQLGHSDTAEFYATRALEIDSLNVPSAYLLARIYNATDRREESERLMRKINPDNETRLKMLADVRTEIDSLADKGLWREALEAYGRYGKLGWDIEPEDKVRLARLQIEAGNYETVLRLINEAEAAMLSDPRMWLYSGKALLALGRRDEATNALQRCIAQLPDNIEARLVLARIYFSRNQVQKAWKELEAVSHLEILDEQLARRFRSLQDSLKAKL